MLCLHCVILQSVSFGVGEKKKKDNPEKVVVVLDLS